ncbi:MULTISPECIES: hypothetical protein [Streptomyces]|nr:MULTISPECIES: hypothetical protein [Streptomyces]AQA14001.1 hypothetical protein BV401_29925 [Streptomyces autolyticus]ATL85448.1 hypothetical protein SMALA_5218 [Streptomyces malaysiensis]AUA11322.1 hypothetical protein CFP59_03433 [Streptomyces sp. M56]MCC4319175.1 hypothetical protein [Streptomyces malaysiensis]MCD9593181.1 hypothetical protein [Streptomyces sp. 8ZJF_21]
METLITVVVILALIAVGALLIHRTNVQNGNRMSPESHDSLPAGGRPRHRPWSRGRQHGGHQTPPPQDRRT